MFASCNIDPNDMIKVPKKIVEKVTTKVKKCQCLIEGCDKKPVRRGICFTHYHMFRRRLLEQPKVERKEFERRNITQGKILPVGAVAQLKRDDPFAE